jgi:hypothetical protein
MEMREPAILLNKVLLPTLGRPTIAATVFAIIQTSFPALFSKKHAKNFP